jgi:hypothetical protein
VVPVAGVSVVEAVLRRRVFPEQWCQWREFQWWRRFSGGGFFSERHRQ